MFLAIGLDSIFVVTLGNYFFGGLRFTDPVLNFQIFAVVCVLPILAFGFLRMPPRIVTKRNAVRRLVPVICGIGLLSLTC